MLKNIDRLLISKVVCIVMLLVSLLLSFYAMVNFDMRRSLSSIGSGMSSWFWAWTSMTALSTFFVWRYLAKSFFPTVQDILSNKTSMKQLCSHPNDVAHIMIQQSTRQANITRIVRVLFVLNTLGSFSMIFVGAIYGEAGSVEHAIHLIVAKAYGGLCFIAFFGLYLAYYKQKGKGLVSLCAMGVLFFVGLFFIILLNGVGTELFMVYSPAAAVFEFLMLLPVQLSAMWALVRLNNGELLESKYADMLYLEEEFN